MVRQVAAPVFSSLGWSSVVALAPILVLFLLLGVFGWRAERAAGTALAAALLVAVGAYGVGIGPALDMAALGALFGLVSVAWVILNALWIYDVTLRSGHFEALRHAFARAGGALPVQVLLIAYGFGGLLEGLIGAGAPVAICGAMLVAAGIAPLEAAVCALIADSVPVAFGTLALPIVALASATGLPLDALGAMVGRQTPLLAALVPFILLFLVGGRRAVREHFVVALLAGIAFGGMQFAVSNYVSVRLADVVAALVASAVIVGVARAPRGAAVTRENGRSRETALALAPYGLIIVVFVGAQWAPVARLLRLSRVAFAWPGLHVALPDTTPVPTIFRVDLLGTTGTLLLLAGLLAVLVLRVPLRVAWRSYRDTARGIGGTVLTVMAIFALAFVANLSGQTRTIGLLLTGLGPIGFALASPLIGWTGSALTGSDSSSNVLFGGLQIVAAKGVGIPPLLAAASNSSGGVVAKAISVQSLAVASATVSLVGQEAAILRRVIGWSMLLLALMCVLSLVQSLPAVARLIMPAVR